MAEGGEACTVGVHEEEDDAQALAMQPVLLTFRSKAVEDEYLVTVSRRRYKVLVRVFVFDLLSFTARFFVSQLSFAPARRPSGTNLVTHGIIMSIFWSLVLLLNARSKGKLHFPWSSGNLSASHNPPGPSSSSSSSTSQSSKAAVQQDTGAPNPMAARQEEMFLSAVSTAALSFTMLKLSSGAGSPADDSKHMQGPLSSFIIIVLGTLLELRWWNPTLLLAIPVLVFAQRVMSEDGLPYDALVHVSMAWAAGALMSYSSDQKRREVFVEHKRAQAAASARAAAEAQSSFMRIMCHEVRTPLQGCIVSAEMLLQNTKLSEEQAELARTVEVSSRTLLMTVSGFLDYFKLNAGKRLEIGQAEVHVKQLCNDVYHIADKLVAGNPNVRVHHPEVSNDVPDSFVSDEHRIMGVLLNLVSNACKNTESGHVRVRLSRIHSKTPDSPGIVANTNEPTIQQMHHGKSYGNKVEDATSSLSSLPPSSSHSGDGEHLLFEVIDTGCGIHPSNLGQLFKDYVQTAAASARQQQQQQRRPKQGGTGLGLSISKRQVASALGGRMGARSASGVGSTFWFTVPLTPPDQYKANGDVHPPQTNLGSNTLQQRSMSPVAHEQRVAHEGQAYASAEAKGEQQQHEQQEMWATDVQEQVHGAKVLLAEDNRQNRMIMSRMMSKVGLRCEDVANGAQAVDIIKHTGSYGYLAVFMDKEMPEMDGWEATRQIRAMGVHTPVIGVTAHFESDGVSRSERTECMRAGCNDMITKPLTRGKLMNVLAAMVKHQQNHVRAHHEQMSQQRLSASSS